MKLLAYLHGYPSVHNAGAEYAMHGVLSWLAARGHQVTVYASSRAQDGILDGVRVVTRVANQEALFCEHDMVFTHLDNTKPCVALAERTGLPVVHYVHNDAQLTFHKIQDGGKRCFVIFNTYWIAEKTKWSGPHCIIRPPVDAARYQTKLSAESKYVTLINMDDNKGGKLFWYCAKRLPQVKFLAVKGSYGRQVIEPIRPPNVTVLENTPNVRDDVYARTRVLLVPSKYESWGRVAMEAACSGIPIIANPTPGLLECLGDDGLFVPREDLTAWVQAIGTLTRDKAAWQQASIAVKARFKENAAAIESELEHFESRLPEIVAMGQAVASPYRIGDTRTFYLAAYPNLRIGPPYDVRFEGGVFTTNNPEAIALLRRCYAAVGLREEVAR